MEQFSNLPEMRDRKEHQIPSLPALNPEPMRCAGCGSKVGSTVLDRVLQRLQAEGNTVKRDDILLGLDAPDDGAVVQVPPEQLMVHTLDHFRSFIDDPYLFGKIAANHSLSDIFAMGATPQSALAMVTVPYGTDEKVEETLYQLLCGAMQVLQQAQTPLVGGHTAEGSELAFGLACNGLVQCDRLLRKSGMQPGQVLILTKALGTGTLFAADMRYRAKGRWIDGVVESMLLSNREAAEVLREYGVTACTDVTGFGLLGHLVEMVRASGVGVELEIEAIPVLKGARETVGQGILSTLHPQNLRAARWIRNPIEHHPNYPLLFDPQTSGGLLAAIPANRAEECQHALQALGYKGTRCIGRAIEVEAGIAPIVMV
jgi:selenide,water dikinase